ncbi:MAG: YlxR family protein [Lachnospiraceae bacterium]|jgi:predicted RNA-binding protein YlxR (DUF448 family)|nr:YlxR family protein [Lachnospiraceae bacterium]
MATKKSMPKRQCIGCGEQKEKRELIRILKTPEDEIVLDATGRKNGRGAYLCHNSQCLEKAFKSKGLDRAFKTAVPREVYDRLREELTAIDQ